MTVGLLVYQVKAWFGGGGQKARRGSAPAASLGLSFPIRCDCLT